MTPNRVHRRSASRQRGVVIIVALVAVLMMALSATMLLRSVEAAVNVAGNLDFMQSSLAAADHAVEYAVSALFEAPLVANPSSDDPAHGYFASRQAAESTLGVPLALQALADYPGGFPQLDAANGNTVRLVIERMCVAAGAPTPDNCALAPVTDPPLAVAGVPYVEPALVPVFRLSIRVDGPRAATQFVQAWLADIPGKRRLAWRALAE